MHPVLPFAASALLLAVPAPAQAPGAPAFDAIAFFAGRTEGIGQLKIVMRAAREVQVHGRGVIERDGALRLRQTVEQAGKPATRREWLIRRVGPGRYAGTLSDAAGPVAGAIVGNRLRLSFAMKRGLRAVQWLTPAADGRSALNRMTVTRLGVPVAHLDETIRRSGD